MPNQHRTLAEEVPQPAIHAVPGPGTHLANVKDVRRVIFEKSGRPDELERRRPWVILKGGIRKKELHRCLQTWRIGKSRMVFVVVTRIDDGGICHEQKYLIAETD